MSNSDSFFKNLVEFLPKHVSIIPSYKHASFAFLLVIIVSYLTRNTWSVDIDRDGVRDEGDEMASSAIHVATTSVIALIVANTVFSISWTLRNRQVNGKHIVYKRWFPSVYGGITK